MLCYVCEDSQTTAYMKHADATSWCKWMWKWMGLFLRKNNLLRCWAWLSLLSWNGVLTLSVLLKLPPSRLEPWFALWSFFLRRLFCISINLPYSYVWNTVVIFGLVLLIATWNCWISYKKWICRTVGPSLAASFDPLAHRQNIASLSLFYRHYFGRCSSEPAQLVPLHYSWGRSTPYSDRLHDVLHTARAWNSLPVEYFPLIYDLRGFKSRINRHLLTVGSFWEDFLYALIFVWFFFL